MVPGIFNYGNQYKGDTLESVAFTITYTGTTTPVDLTGTTVKCQFRKPFNGAIVADLSLGNGLTMDDPDLGIIVIDDILELDWDVDNYRYDIEFTYPTGRIKTYIKGTINIVSDTSI